MRHIFVRTNERRFPIVGDLISERENTPEHINIVLEVVPGDPSILNGWERWHSEEFVLVRSVRYGHTNSGNFVLSYGKRSRWIKMWKDRAGGLMIVKEYAPLDNEALRNQIVASLENIDTTWRPKNAT